MASNLPNLIFYDTPARNADLRYFGKFDAPDAFLALRIKGRSYGVFHALEYARAKRQSVFDEVLSMEALMEGARASHGNGGIAGIACFLAGRKKAKDFVVGETFPLGLARELEKGGLSLQIGQKELFPQRAVKTPAEAAAIRQTNRCVSAAFSEVERILHASKIKNGFLYFEGKKLTSERLRTRIDLVCLAHGAVACDTIAAGGDQACDPHEVGKGALKPGELIVVDIFPRGASGYYGDMTRTYLKGRPTSAQCALVDTVRQAQKVAIKALHAGVTGAAVHSEVEAFFCKRGFKTYRDTHGYSGFFHGTGHGVGLEVHEAPRVSVKGGVLAEGTVVTVEPGLYYRGIGGCRIEDVVQLTKTGVRMLSKHPYRWQID